MFRDSRVEAAWRSLTPSLITKTGLIETLPEMSNEIVTQEHRLET